MTKKPTVVILENCENYENKLDLFNLLLIRQRVDREVELLDKVEAAAAAEQQQQQQKGSWFSGWWGSKEDTALQAGNDGDISKC